MIRRNTAGQVIYLPQLTTTDGTAITSSATLTVAKDGTEAASAGTLAHSANGVWKYTPTQAETDAAIVGLILTGTSAVPVVLNLITTGADTSAVAFGANTATPLDATGTRSAIGLGSANLDTQLADLPTVAEFEARSLPSADYFVVGDYTAPPTASAIADSVLTESVMDHRNVANSLAKFVWQIRQANLTVDGTVSNAITPTTLTFASNVAATTSAYAHAVLLFITGPLTGENSPIISYNNTNGVFVLEEPLTAAPSNGDEFVVIAGSHVHSVADIQSGLAFEATLTDIKTKTDQLTFTVANQVDSNALSGGGSGLDAAGVRAAVGLASANLDTQLSDIPTVSEFEARSIPSADYFVVSDYTAPLDASGVRSAVGLATANLDTQLADLPTVAEFDARSLPSADYFVVTDYTAPPTVSQIITAASSNAATPPLERNIGDTNPVTFQWLANDSTITAQRSINNATYEGVSGAIAFLRTDGTKHLYTLAYNVADRPPTNGSVRYAFTDGTYTRYLTLRISGANTVTPPTASANASQVRTELTTELGRIDATISSRSTFAGGAVASVTYPVTVATNNDKTGYALATAPPTASEVATQVRTELSTELARVDATVSSRSTLTAANVWEHATRSLTTFGTLVSDIWSNATRTLTAISDSSGITTLLGRIAGNIRTSADDVSAETAQTAAIRSGLALEATLDAAETAILAAIDGIEGSGLTGDYTLTVTITDGDTDEPIEAATVTLFRSGERGVEPTDDEGEAIFGVDAATWSYVVRASGYQSATGTKVIAANDTLAVELTPIVVNQAAAPACNVVLPVIDQYLAPAAEVLVCIEFLSFLPNATKTAVIVNHPPSLLSDANGQVEVTLARLAKYRATYQVRNESPKRVEFSTPNAGSFIVVEA